jgi:hypothetical protein
MVSFHFFLGNFLTGPRLSGLSAESAQQGVIPHLQLPDATAAFPVHRCTVRRR